MTFSTVARVIWAVLRFSGILGQCLNTSALRYPHRIKPQGLKSGEGEGVACAMRPSAPGISVEFRMDDYPCVL